MARELRKMNVSIESHTYGSKHLITVDCGMDRVVIMEFYAEDELYSRGLQYSYENLVDMSQVCTSVAQLMENLLRSAMLNETSYVNLLSLVVKYVKAFKPYEVLIAFLKEHPDGE